jgi:hypothetical protein
MNKPLWTAEQIQEELKTQVSNIKEINDDGANILIPLPTWHAEDDFGVNWEISSIPSVICVAEIHQIIDQLRFQVNLKR